MTDFADLRLADRYLLERELGRGGMATVWLARDLRHERTVAIKILHAELAGANGVDRFLREIRLTAKLQHPHIVPILDSGVLTAGEGTTLPWYAMAFLEGESLRARMAREGQLPIEDALSITEAVAGALQTAHRQGIVHRDIKPENIFLSDGRAYVVDFGIAKALSSEGERLTSTGLAIGTPAYMSPEQGFGGEVDARSDQYSLATVLYEMLTGDPPFSGTTPQSIMARRLTEPARPLVTVRSTVPVTVETAILRALERTPADRFADVQAFAAALRAAHSTTTRRFRWQRWAVAAGLGILATGSGWWLATRAETSRPPAEAARVADLVARGVRAYDKRTPAGVAEAISLFEAAIATDSAYAPAWNGLATAYVRADQRYFAVPGVSGDSVIQRAVSAVDRALALDSLDANSWVTRATLSQRVDPTDHGPALRSLSRAMALDSTHAAAWHFLAMYTTEQGDPARGLEMWRRSVKANPSYTQGLAFLGLGHYWRGDFDSAAYWADSAIAVEPNYLLGRSTVGYIAVERGDWARGAASFEAARRLSTAIEVVNSMAGSALVAARAGRRAEARSVLRRADSLAAGYAPTPLHTAVYLAQAYAALGDADAAIGWLARYATVADLHFQLHLRCDPPFAPIRTSPRLQALLSHGPTGEGLARPAR